MARSVSVCGALAFQPPRRHVGFFCFLAVLVIGYVDYWLGTNITLSVVYAVPISAAALFIGAVPALWLSLFAVVVSMGGDYLLIEHAIPHARPHAPSANTIRIVNGVLRLLFFAFHVMVLTRLRQLHAGL